MKSLTYLTLAALVLVGVSNSAQALTELDYPGTNPDILGVIDEESNVPATPVAKVYFTAQQTDGKWAVFVHDVRKNGGENIKSTKVGSFVEKPDQFVNDRLKPYFHVKGKGLYTIQKVDGKLKAVKIFNSDPDPANPMYGLIVWDEGKLAFAAYKSDTGYEPWISNGKKSGTKMLKDINPGAASSFPYSFTGQYSYVGALLPAKLFFGATNGPVATADGYQLWVSTGKSDETFSINVTRQDSDENNLDFAPFHITNVNETIFFANSGTTDETSNELWSTEGSLSNTVCESRGALDAPTGLDPYNAISGIEGAPFAVSGANVYFEGTSIGFGSELWVASPNFAPFRATDINTGGSSAISNIVPGSDDGMVYFKAFNGTNFGLYRRVSGDTALISDSADNLLREITWVSGQIYFIANNKLRRVENAFGEETSVEVLDDLDQTLPNPGDLHRVVSPATPGFWRLYFVQNGTVSFVENP